MKKLLTILTVFFIQISFSQSSDFVRPTVSFVVAPYNNGEDIGRLTDGSFASFDLLKLQNGQLGISANPKKNKVTDEYNEAATNVAKSISGLVWDEVFAINAGTPDYSKMMQRAANTMTENQRAGFVATMQGLENSAKNKLIMPLLDATYIIVLSPASLTTDVGKNSEGYQTDLSWAVFKVDLALGMNISSSVNMFEEKFDGKWNDVKSAEFPVKLIASGATTASSTQSTKDVLGTNKSMSELRSQLDLLVPATAIAAAQKDVQEFLPRTALLNDMKIALGTKEGLSIDDRYWSYQLTEDENGKTGLKRMGRDRVKSVGNNNVDLIANPDAVGERTQLYADGGRKSQQGMISMYKPETGIGITGGVKIGDGYANYSIRADYRTKIKPNLFLYIEYDIIPDVTYLGYPGTATVGSLGLKKAFNVGRMFQPGIFASYAVLSEFTANSYSSDAIELSNAPVQVGLDLAFKFGSLHVVPQVSFNTDEDLYGSAVTFGGGLRFNF